ncbi:MAG: energy-dependent translational throttle protein EttA, partial [Acidobacteriota bacterium]|nr:energy-dependent translational throttle protein EttA [Acidobacteriota bacterium]
MAPQFVYTMKGLGKVYPPDAQVLKDIWLSFLPGAKIGVLGLNGAGKSTLLKIMAGVETSFVGEAFPGQGVSIGYLPQEPVLNPDKDVRGNVEEGVAEIKALLDRYDAVNAKLGEDMSPEEMDKVMDEQSRLQDRIDATNAWDLDSRLDLAMEALRCPPPDASVSTLSGGERRRVALCRLLLLSPDLLLLDEPTNHLDAESVAWLERFLKDYPGTVVAITHDRYFLDNVAGWILELDRGSGIPYEGNYTGWLEQKSNRLQVEEKTESKRQRSLQRELDWIRMSPRARQAKGKARLNAYEELLAEDTAKKVDSVEIYIPPGPRLGDVVVEARGLKKAFGDTVLFDDLNFTLPPAGIVGVIGPNGAGKTTTFRLITGQEQPDGGTLKLGQTVQVGYVDQSRDALDPNKSVYDEITDGLDELEMGKKTVASRAYVSWFNFKGGQQQRKVGTLSGGERNRVHLAKLLRKGSYLLLLDEPTHDLDVDT